MRTYNSFQCLHKLEEFGGGIRFNEIQDKFVIEFYFLKGWGPAPNFFSFADLLVIATLEVGLKP